VPEGVRWWTEEGARFVDGKCRISERWRRAMRQVLGAVPRALVRAGRPAPVSPRGIVAADVRALKERSGWAPSTLKTNLLVLRWFVRWAGNPVAETEDVWVTPRGASIHRRWLTASQLGALWEASRGRERLLVALEGFNGLRRIEVLRLRVRDLNLALPNPTMNVLGKGRDGGKWRTIPVQQVAYAALVEASAEMGPNDRLYTLHKRTADHDLRAAAVRAGLGIRVSGHDLRRSFGRIAYQAGVSLVDLKYLYGHESVDMTAHYIGLDESAARKGLEAFGEAMRTHLTALPAAGA
jgi:integrase